MFDWIHDRHVEKGLWYAIFFGAGAALGAITQFLVGNSLNLILTYTIIGGASAVLFTFLSIEGGHHLGNRR